MATYFVDPVNGLDTNAGTSPTTAWLTLGYATDPTTNLVVVADDVIVLMNTGVFALTANLTWTFGDLYITGANASGVIDGTQATIQATTGFVTTDILVTVPNQTYLTGIIFDANALAVNALSASTYTWIDWCVFKNATAAGVVGGNLACSFSHSRFTGSATYGMDASGSLFACRFDHNTGVGCRNAQVRAYNCVFDHNGSAGFDIYGGTTRGAIINCVSDNNGGYGFRHRSSGNFINCIATRNSTYGFAGSGGTMNAINCLVGSGAMANTSGGLIYVTDSGTITADPLFTAPDATPPDYTLQAGSPAINAGFGGAL